MGPKWFVNIMRVVAVLLVIIILALTMYFIIGIKLGPVETGYSVVTIQKDHLNDRLDGL